MKKFILLNALILVMTSGAMAAIPITTKTVEYQDNTSVYEGYFVYPSVGKGKLPVVVLIHAWKGLGTYEKNRADEMAQWGYAVLAIDMYGKGVRPASAEQAATLSGALKRNRELLRSRAILGINFAKTLPRVDASRIAVTGFCFGGGAALEVARAGVPIKGVASFHGNLDTPKPSDARNIKGKVLVLTGADDPFVPTAQIAAFESEMRAAEADWQLVKYGNAVHAFTDPGAGSDPQAGAAYNEAAAKRSLALFRSFLTEVFGN